MQSRPWPVVIICLLFLIAGCVGFIYHFTEMFEGGSHEAIWVELLRLLAIVCAILLWKGINWARWLAIAWVAYHVVISAKHSTAELITHIIVLILVAVLLYLPKSAVYFSGAGPHQASIDSVLDKEKPG
ncbi:MAG: hypothetical protein JNK79_02685 [Chitinophagaceae bacterium]|nr:hypothetical protein [Chitinophagaceae bacterium]